MLLNGEFYGFKVQLANLLGVDGARAKVLYKEERQKELLIDVYRMGTNFRG